MNSRLIIMGKKELKKELFCSVKNMHFINKPEGGLWAAPYRKNDRYVSSWHEWCDSQMDGWVSPDCILLSIKDDARVCTINSFEDLEELVNATGEQALPFKLPLSLRYVDFEAAQKLYDVIYLTEDGQNRTRWSTGINLYGWDCESVLIMNWDAIKSWEYKHIDLKTS